MKIIIIDDDPTGSQTVHDCLLLLKWDYQTLYKGLNSESDLLFILANTRSLSEEHATKRLEDICLTLKDVLNDLEIFKDDYLVISRGDSTLRGHNFLEPQVINNILGPFDATFYIPAFIEGNRITIDGKHFVDNVPAHETIYAKDEIFGFQTNDINKLIHDKSLQKIRLNQIKNIFLKDIELLELESKNKVFNMIWMLKENSQVVVDVRNYFDLNKFCAVIQKLIKQKRFIFRTAASFITSISNLEENDKTHNYYSKLRRRNNNNKFFKGFIIIGSFVDISTLQLKKTLAIKLCKGIELDVINFYKLFKSKDNYNQFNSLKKTIIMSVRKILKFGLIPVLFTSRKRVTCESKNELIIFQNQLSLFIAEIVAEIKGEIGYLISKGGITSNNILSHGFNVDSVYLEGQIFPGISLVTIANKNKHDKLPFVTFPGNIGDENSLVQVIEVLENKKLKVFNN
tara:strand:- start:1081 stop:2451 length:1371 start_codon:yes stop_codon:yes gene_type:complete